MKTSTGNLDFTIRPLRLEDAVMISAMLRAQPPDYARFFYAFDFSQEQISDLLEKTIRDVYSGMFWGGELVGIFMLRGWDDGYDIPSFGVFISEKYRGGTLMRISLDVGKMICRLSGVRRLMATIHPDNISPRGAARLGFVQTGAITETGNIVYHMDL